MLLYLKSIVIFCMKRIRSTWHTRIGMCSHVYDLWCCYKFMLQCCMRQVKVLPPTSLMVLFYKVKTPPGDHIQFGYCLLNGWYVKSYMIRVAYEENQSKTSLKCIYHSNKPEYNATEYSVPLHRIMMPFINLYYSKCLSSKLLPLCTTCY